MKKSAGIAPWWLEPGTEICPACSHTYVFQTEYRCVTCDGVLCPMCVETTFEAGVFCVGCASRAEEEQR